MKKILFTIAAVSLITFGACKKDEPDTGGNTGGGGSIAAPTLDKANLLDKLWQSKSGATEVYCKTGGTFSTTGTWKWLNDSDSMEIMQTSGSSPKTWYFKYCQGDSLEVKVGNTGGYIKMKDHDW